MLRGRWLARFLQDLNQSNLSASHRRKRRIAKSLPTQVIAETLEDRLLLSNDPVGIVLELEKGADPNSVLKSRASSGNSDNDVSDFTFSDTNRWSQTTTNGSGLQQGDATTLTWSFLPDDTATIAGRNDLGNATTPSNLIARLGEIYGVTTDDLNYTDEPWFVQFESYLNRWGEVSGLSYVYEPTDDGAAFPGSQGQTGVRGDIRIGGHTLDGNSGVLAYNWFPNRGDMVIDTNDSFYNNTGGNSIRLRNVLSHEHGHGIGIAHVCPVIGGADGRLMEPFINTSFDGPQFDDILATQRGYGDALEKNGGNDTTATATDLGTLVDGVTVSVGTDSNDNRVSPDETDFISIDDDSDVDVFEVTVGPGMTLDLTLTPTGPTYLSGPQNSDGTCSDGTNFNASEQSDLTLELIGSDGTTVLQTSNAAGLGGAESITTGRLSSGSYFVRISGTANAAQMYQLDTLATQLDLITVDPAGDLSVTEDGLTDTYEMAFVLAPTGEVEVTITADAQTEVSVDGTNFGPTAVATFSNTTPQTITLRAIDDVDLEGTHTSTISHAITSTADPANFPVDLPIPDLVATVFDNDRGIFEYQSTAGSLIAAAPTSSGTLIDSSSSVDYVFPLEAGQAFTAVATPDANVQLTLELVGVASATSPANGDSAAIPLTPIPADGSYTLRVTGTGATDFEVQSALNAFLETAAGDSSTASAFDINAPAMSLSSTGVRRAVIGSSQPAFGAQAFTQFNDPAAFIDISGTGTALNLGDDDESTITTTVGNTLLPAGSVTVGNNGGIIAGSGADLDFENLTLPTADFTTAILPFWDDIDSDSGNVFWEERVVNGINTLIVQWHDRPHFSNVGDSRFQIQLFETGPLLLRFAYPDVDFGDAGFDGGASATIGYQENTTTADQFSFDTAVLNDNDVVDLASPVTADVDEYTFSLLTGSLVDIAVTGLDGADFSDATVELIDTDGTTVLATATPEPLQAGVPSSNVDLAIARFAATAAGVYSVRVTSNMDGARYGLMVTDATTFDLEPNDATSDPLRSITDTNTVLGFLSGADTSDSFLIGLSAGEQLLATAETSFKGNAVNPLNDLNPELEVYRPDGSLLASDLDSLNGRDPQLSVTAPTDGVYRVRVAATGGAGHYIMTTSVTAFSLTLALDDASISENGGSTIATLTRTGDLSAVATANLTNGDTSEISLPATVDFAAGSATTMFTVDAVDDTVVDGTQTVSITAAIAGVVTTSQSIDVIDDELAGLTVTPPGVAEVSEDGTSITFDVVLDGQPESDVVIEVSSQDTSEVASSPALLTFTNANWNTPQTATLTGVDDTILDGDQAVVIDIAVDDAASNDAFDGLSTTLNVTNLDNDVADYSLSTTNVSVSEDGTTATVDLQLVSQPTGDVALGLALSDATEASIDSTQLTFTSANWNVAQQITVTGLDDSELDGNIASTLTISVDTTASIAAYNGLADKTVAITTVDNDVAGFGINTGSVSVSEAGTTATAEVTLDAIPNSDVVLTVTSDDSSEASASPATLTFTSANWNTPQEITITGIDDALLDGDVNSTVTVAIDAANSDPAFATASNQTISVTTVDDELAEISVSQSAVTVSEDLTSETFTIQLSAAPLGDVLLDVATNDASEASVSPILLTFTPSNWNSPQTVSVTGVDDASVDGNVASTVTVSVNAASHAGYLNAASQSVSVTTNDNDVAGFMVADSSLNVTEGGASANTSIVLTAAPLTPVVFTTTSSLPAQATASPTTITFTSTNWNTPQDITVTAIDDNILDGTVAVDLTVAIDDSNSNDAFDLLADSVVSVSVDDNDVAGFSVSETSLSIVEGATDTFTVQLGVQPLTDVIFNLSSAVPTAAVADQAALTFTAANWDQPQTATLSAIDDAIVDGTQTTVVRVAVDGTSDAGFTGLATQQVIVDAIDNDTAGLSLSASSVNLSEAGGFSQILIQLTAEPVRPVIFDLASSDTGEAVPITTSVTFNPTNWSQPQVVTVAGVDDSTVDGTQNGQISITANPASQFEFLTLSESLNFATADDDIAGATPDSPTLSIVEGSTGTIGFSLDAAPINPVVFNVATSNASEAAIDLTSLTFTAANWDTPQTVTVTAGDDPLVDGPGSATVTFSVDPANSDAAFAAIADSTVDITTIDDDVAEISLSATDLTVTEDGGTATFDITLAARPVTNVALALSLSDSSEVSASVTAFIFTTTTWNSPQTVTLTGLDDVTVDGDVLSEVTISVLPFSSDAAFGSTPSQTINLTTTDNDVAGFTANLAGTTELSESGTTTDVQVALSAQPLTPVVFSVVASDLSEVSASSSSLTFLPENWDSPQTLTLTGQDDFLPDGPTSSTVTLEVDTQQSDAAFNALTAETFTITVTDDEVGRLDIDRNGNANAASDGILAIRYLIGFRSNVLVDNAIGQGAQNNNGATVTAALDGAPAMLDVDGDGDLEAATDGILIIRYLLGFTGDVLVNNAIGINATRTTGPEVRAYLDYFLPTSTSSITEAPGVSNIVVEQTNTATEAPAFTWPEVDSAESYIVRIETAAGDTVTSVKLSTPAFELSDPLPAGNYRIWVEALGLNSVIIATGSLDFEVASDDADEAEAEGLVKIFHQSDTFFANTPPATKQRTPAPEPAIQQAPVAEQASTTESASNIELPTELPTELPETLDTVMANLGTAPDALLF